MSNICYACKKTGDLRPYGVNMQLICFKCMTDDPEKEKVATEQFYAQLDACNGSAIIGEPTGPRPIHEVK